METRTLAVDAEKFGSLAAIPVPGDILDDFEIKLDLTTADAQNIQHAAEQLRTSDVPVAFPTETVYGLGADATRSAAVRGIYKAKQRPSDNPLIIHFASLRQLRSLLKSNIKEDDARSSDDGKVDDPVPEIYHSLISRFWPGPLTIILPNPSNSPLAPEVTAGLSTFGARMPKNVLALALIQLADVPIAAPSANASTKPSPTAAEHVAYDLEGRIETIIDGGPCDVGVESTVVDGLSQPPLILRPGGISLSEVRSCPGWETTQIGYKNVSEKDGQPRAPGMKYRHYSPKATVVLFEAGHQPPSLEDLQQQSGSNTNIGIIRTKSWLLDTAASSPLTTSPSPRTTMNGGTNGVNGSETGFSGMLKCLKSTHRAKSTPAAYEINTRGTKLQLRDMDLGPDTANIARGIFSALRELDREGVSSIFVEGIDDNQDDTAAAIMNRLRKAAEIRISS